MKSVESIIVDYAQRKAAQGKAAERMREIKAHYAGDVVVPLPEIDKNEKVAVANLMAQGIDAHGMRIASTFPEISMPPLKPGIKRSEEKARSRKKASYGWLEANEYDIAVHQRARWLIAYASTPVMIRPDFKRKIPQWEIRNPLDAYPSATLNPTDMCPDDVIFAVTRSVGWLSARGYNAAAVMARMQNAKKWVSGQPQRDTEVEVVEYEDGDEIVLVACGSADPKISTRGDYGDTTIINLGGRGGDYQWATQLERIPNRTGMCLAVTPGRITLDDPKGQFDDLVGLFQQQAKLMAMEVNAVARAIWPDTYLVARQNELPKVITVADGQQGILGVVQGGDIKDLNSQPGFQTYPTIDRLERAQRLAGGIPAEFGGECVDEATEILTAAGWKQYDEVSVGDEVLTLNHDTGMSEWQPVLKMNVFPAQQREVVEMEGPRFSALSTKNHRWPVIRRDGSRVWRLSGELTSNDRIPIAAMNADLPAEPKWSDALVEAVAWYWTEGSDRDSGAQLSQSTKNPENVERIRACLTSLFGQATSGWKHLSGCGQGGAGHDGVPRWNEAKVASNGVIKFNLSKHAGDVLREHAPDKVPSFAFLRSLTAAQLELFIHVSMLADNCGPARLGQKVKARTEAFAFACILAGRGVSYQHRVKLEARPGWRPGEYEAHIVRMKKRRYAKPVENAYRGASTFRTVVHDGIVWCPTTPNGSWFARRNGKAYFTGNSSTNIRTGRRGDSIISATVDFPVQEAQLLLSRSLRHELERAVAVSKAYFGKQSTSFYVSWKGATGHVDYTPNDIFEQGAPIVVRYSSPGSDVNGLAIRNGQKLGTGMISRQTAREQDPEIPDAEAEKDRVIAESLMDALLSSIQSQAADPQGPYQPVDIARLAQLVASNEMELPEAVMQIQREAQERQAAQVEPDSPEAQPGLSLPGMGVEPPPTIAEPAPSVENLAQVFSLSRRPQMALPAEVA